MTQGFQTVTGTVAPLLLDDVNTDLIVPIERCLDVPREALGHYAFEPLRYDEAGAERPGFLLNRAEFRNARILLAGLNFGCGSSREAAAWALGGFGFRVIVARSFGEIFENNWVRNGYLPVALDDAAFACLEKAATGARPLTATVSLAERTIAFDGTQIRFAFDDARRDALLKGADAIDATMASLGEIAAFQQRDRIERPWIWHFGDIDAAADGPPTA